MKPAFKSYNKILVIDIGQGTQDILLYDPHKNIENCISLILPSPTALYGKIIDNCSEDLYISGSTIGGGIISRAIKDHIKRGYAVFMETEAAASIRDNLDSVRKMGICIGKPKAEFNGKTLHLREVNLSRLKEFFAHFSEDMDVEVVAIAVQDHGTSPEGKSDRVFRFEVIARRLLQNNLPESFAFWAEEIPSFFTRMTSLAKSIKEQFSGKILIMDTVFCALLGCIEDRPEPYIIVNVGNDHTLCAIIKDRRIDAIMEHHTGMLTPEKLRALLIRFSSGVVTNQEIYDDWGHGALYINKHCMPVGHIIATGPHREKMRQTGFPVSFAAPGGNMMLTGPIGLVKACQLKGLSP